MEEDDQLDDDVVTNKRFTNDMDDDTDDEIDSEWDSEEDDELDDDATPPTHSTPKTREVLLQHIKPLPLARKPGQRTTHKKKKASHGTEVKSWHLCGLGTWVGESVAKVGKDRTIQVVETYAASGGSLSTETKSSILQLASFASDAEPAGPVGNQEMLGLMVGLDQILGEQ